jgi:signal transduction histidine kinase
MDDQAESGTTHDATDKLAFDEARQQIDAMLDEADACLHTDTPRSLARAQEALRRASAHAYSAGEARSLRQLAACYMVDGGPAGAIPYAITSLTLALESDLPCEAAYAFRTIGTLQGVGGDSLLAAETFMDGLELAEDCDDATLLVVLHLDLAGAYHDLADYDRQIRHVEQVFRYVDQVDDPARRRARALASLGSAYVGKHDYAKALDPLTQALAAAEEHRVWDLQASALNSLAWAYLGLAAYDQAEALLQRAVELATAHDLTQWKIAGWINLADWHTARDQPEQALACLNTGLALTQDMAYSEHEKGIHRRLAETYEQQGEYQRALDHYRSYHTLHELDVNRDTQTRIQVMKMRLDLDSARRGVEFQRLRDDVQRHKTRERERSEATQLEKERLRIALEEERKTTLLKEQILTRLAPEFRTPLSRIKASARLLTSEYDHLSDEQRRGQSETINDAVTWLDTMLRDIVGVLRRDPEAASFKRQSVVLADLCQDAIDAAEEQTKSSDRVRVTVQPATVEMHTNLHILTEIITHLLTNALKFSQDEVDLSVRYSNEMVRIMVADRGIGIPPEEHARVFEPFYRASNLDEIQGTGLGLSIVQNNVARLSGRVDLTSIPGEGTTVTVHLPLAP